MKKYAKYFKFFTQNLDLFFFFSKFSNAGGDPEGGSDYAILPKNPTILNFLRRSIMKKFLTSVFTLFILSVSSFAQPQPPDTLWTHTYGGTGNDEGRCIQQTADGGFIIVGTYNNDAPDIYLIRTNAVGDTLWTRTYGSSYPEWANDVKITTPDNGLIVTGTVCMSGYTNKNVLLLKLNANGDSLWSANFGSDYDDWGKSVCQTTDGGYVITGYKSFGYFNQDIYLIKTNSTGTLSWERTYGGSFNDQGNCVIQTDDNGFVIAGSYEISSADGQAYIIKTNQNGDIVWELTYGNSYYDNVYYIQKIAPNNGYIVVGRTGIANSNGDILLIKLNLSGSLQWANNYGGSWNDEGYCVRQTVPDNNFIITGRTDLPPGNIQDLYFFKVDPIGNMIWSDTLGGNLHDAGNSVIQTTDGGYAIVGYYTQSALNMDFYLLRFQGELILPIVLQLTPHNPPITIPAAGGSFQFDIDIANFAASAFIIDVWTSITNPSGTEFTIISRNNMNFPAGATISRDDLTQMVPASALPGTYSYNAYVRDHNTWETLAEDNFPFTKLPGDGAPAHNEGWACYGWDDASTFDLSPLTFDLSPASPNPFNPSTTLSYSLPVSGEISLTVYDIQGREVAVLFEGNRAGGTYEAVFDGSTISSGVYFAVLQAGEFRQTQKLVLIK